MKQPVVQGQPAQILLSKEPKIFRFDVREGALVCLFDPRTSAGAAVLLRPTAGTSGNVLANMVKSFSGLTGNEAKNFIVKVVGRSGTLTELESSFRKLELTVSKQLKEDQKTLEVFFYSDSGRIRLAGQAEAPKVFESKTEPIILQERKRKVLIVDDSKTIRQLLTRVLSSDSRIEVVGAAERPSQVAEMIERLKPDVITLDIHMPEMDGVTLLKEVIVPKFGIPTVMITSIRMEDGPAVLQALEFGAIDYIQKPSLEEMESVTPQIIEKVYSAASAQVGARKSKLRVVREKLEDLIPHSRMPILCIGSSTGGTEAIRQMFEHLPAGIPPILIVQHIPAVFSEAFARRLNEICPFEVKEAADGDEVKAGRVLIAPGGKQMKLNEVAGQYFVAVNDDPPVNRFKPSVDYFMLSAAPILRKRAVGIILTGMGADGAKGLLKMRENGARTIAQDQATSVVYGMPRVAAEIGAAETVAALDEIPYRVWEWIRSPLKKQ